MDATLNWLEWFGAACTPSEFDLTINWDLDLSSTIKGKFVCLKGLLPTYSTLNSFFSSS
jgi:hypothetical protein